GITVSGVTKTVSADTDAAQLRTSTVTVPIPSTTAIASGPIVLTALITHQNSTQGSSLDLYITSTTCTDTANTNEIFPISPSTGGEPSVASVPGRIWV